MKKQMFVSFLLGLVIPLVLMGVLLRNQPLQQEQETTGQAVSADTIELQNDDGSILEMDMQTYLVGVVLAEMPASFPEEALKAQAVVARTYAARRQTQQKHPEGAVCLQASCCQGYREEEAFLRSGGTQESLEKVRRAVEQTAGQVLTYEGELIDATYFSCSGGSTEAAVAVWGSDVPYLQAVDSPGEEEAAYYTEEIAFNAQDFAACVGFENEGDPSQWFSDITYTEGGGVDRITIRGVEYRGTRLRTLLGLRSTFFEIQVDGNWIYITTHGYGHRVGMSQYGAKAMAEGGSSYEEILTHYYVGAELENWD